MVNSQRMRIANEKASKNVTQRGNVPKTSVSNQVCLFYSIRTEKYYRYSCHKFKVLSALDCRKKLL